MDVEHYKGKLREKTFELSPRSIRRVRRHERSALSISPAVSGPRMVRNMRSLLCEHSVCLCHFFMLNYIKSAG